MAKQFPHSLGPFALDPVDISLYGELQPEAGTWAMPRTTAALKPLAASGLACRGKLSPGHPITLDDATRELAGIPKEATRFAWAYPEQDVLNVAPTTVGRLTKDPEACVVLYGGFMYFDVGGKMVAAKSVRPAKDGLWFEAPKRLPFTVNEVLEQQLRWEPVTAGSIREAGATEFCWVPPDEFEGIGMPSPCGCFCYRFEADLSPSAGGSGASLPHLYFNVAAGPPEANVEDSTTSAGGAELLAIRKAKGRAAAVAIAERALPGGPLKKKQAEANGAGVQKARGGLTWKNRVPKTDKAWNSPKSQRTNSHFELTHNYEMRQRVAECIHYSDMLLAGQALPPGFRRSLLRLQSQRWFITNLTILLLMDAVFVMGELAITGHPSCVPTMITCAEPLHADVTYPLQGAQLVGCDVHTELRISGKLLRATQSIRYSGLAVTLLFLIQGLLLIYAYGTKQYFSLKHWHLHVDLILVAVAIILELTLDASDTQSTLAIFTALWRCLRIFHGLMMTAHSLADIGSLPSRALFSGIQVFRRFDSDGNGGLDCDELGMMLGQLNIRPPLTEEEVSMLHQELDEDSGGTASFTEFVPWWMHITSQSLGISQVPGVAEIVTELIAELRCAHLHQQVMASAQAVMSPHFIEPHVNAPTFDNPDGREETTDKIPELPTSGGLSESLRPAALLLAASNNNGKPPEKAQLAPASPRLKGCGSFRRAKQNRHSTTSHGLTPGKEGAKSPRKEGPQVPASVPDWMLDSGFKVPKTASQILTGEGSTPGSPAGGEASPGMGDSPKADLSRAHSIAAASACHEGFLPSPEGSEEDEESPNQKRKPPAVSPLVDLQLKLPAVAAQASSPTQPEPSATAAGAPPGGPAGAPAVTASGSGGAPGVVADGGALGDAAAAASPASASPRSRTSDGSPRKRRQKGAPSPKREAAAGAGRRTSQPKRAAKRRAPPPALDPPRAGGGDGFFPVCAEHTS